MAEAIPHQLQLWDGRSAGDPVGARADVVKADPAKLAAEGLARQEVFQPRGRLHLDGEPLTLPWFLAVERRRYNRHGRWIPRLLEFHKHDGESVLAVGGSLGIDWAQYARHGADVQVVPPTPAVGQAMRQHFDERHVRLRLVAAAEAAFPVENASLDVVALNYLDSACPPLDLLAREAFRVLRPGGKVILLARAWWDIDAWWGWLPWYGLLGPRSVIDPPGQSRHSARQVRQAFAAFGESRCSRRHLRRAEVPHICRIFPLPLLERIVGRVLVFKAFKPISAARPASLAA